jgi:DNA-binding NarL/FixJ family response regulator
VVVEDEPLYRDLLCAWLERAGFVVVGVFADPVSALRVTPALSPDVALLDIELGSSVSGVEIGIGLRRSMPSLGIVLLSNHMRPHLLTVLPGDVAGGWSYLSKRTVSDLDALSRAITGAAEGLVVFDAAVTAANVIRAGSPIQQLSPRQRQIVALIAQGYSNKAIGEHLVLTEKSVENHVTRIYQVVGIDAHDPVNHQRVRMALLYVASTTEVPPYSRT